MNYLSRSRITIACLALFSMLFMQLAVASYSCPMMTQDLAANVAMAVMADCDGMDMAQPTLCYTHANGEAARQSADNAGLPPVAPFVPAGFLLTLAEIDSMPAISAPTSDLLVRSSSPPLTIRHCCFRI